MTDRIRDSKISQNDIAHYRGALLDWYDGHSRDVPWRVRGGGRPDPYKVWLSEIMCQQTTVGAVRGYYSKFLALWPSVHDLAAADAADVMAAWAGLGYYARARNLHACAQIVANDFGGVFPDTQDALKALPGIGDYTSAAIAAIAFNQPATVVDGNVERVMARFFAVEEPIPHAKKTLKALAHEFYDGFTARPGDLAQSFMDLGAGVCIPKAPRCGLCPLQERCLGHADGIAAELPRKIKKADRPKRFGNFYWVENESGQFLFETRPAKGLLGGMVGLPTTAWHADISVEKHPEYIVEPALIKNKAFHTFTHFDLEMRLFTARIRGKLPKAMFWADPAFMADRLPSVFKKAFHAMTGEI